MPILTDPCSVMLGTESSSRGEGKPVPCRHYSGVALIDTCCARFRPVFHNVRHFEQFTQLLLSLVAETKRKSLPRLAKSVQGEAQALRQEMQRRYRYFLYWVFGFPALTIGVVALLMLTIFPQ